MGMWNYFLICYWSHIVNCSYVGFDSESYLHNRFIWSDSYVIWSGYCLLFFRYFEHMINLIAVMVGTEKTSNAPPMVGHERIFNAAQWSIILSKFDMNLFRNQRNERISYTLRSHGFDFNDVVRASWRLKLLPATLLLCPNIILVYDRKRIKSLHYSSLCGDRWVHILKGHWRRKCDHAITKSCTVGCLVTATETLDIAIALRNPYCRQLQSDGMKFLYCIARATRSLKKWTTF